MKKILYYISYAILIILVYEVPSFASNPVTAATPYTGNGGCVLGDCGSTANYANSCINKVGDTIWVTTNVAASDLSSGQNCFATASASSFPSALTLTGNCLPQIPSSGAVDSCSNYFTGVATPNIFFEQTTGVYHGFVGDFLLTDSLSNMNIGTFYQNIAHLTANGTETSFPSLASNWTYEGCQLSSIGSVGQTIYAVEQVAPLAGGGIIMFVNGYNVGPIVNGTALGEGIYYMVNTTTGYPSSGWSTPTLAITNSPKGYSEFTAGFWYGNKYYLIVNWFNGNVPSGPLYTYLYSSSTQQSSSWDTESTALFTTPPYVTGLAGYSLNSGSAVGVDDVEIMHMVQWSGVGAFTLTATPISNPQPVLSNISHSCSGSTCTVSGTVALGSGSTPLWEVGLHNTTQGTYSQCAWTNAGVAAASSTNTFTSCSITASNGDSIDINAFDVGQEKATQTFTASGLTPYTISGTVSGAVQSGVTVACTGQTSTTTASDGTYNFTGLSAGTYTITPSKTGYTFSPTTRTPTISSANVTGQDFTASAVVVSSQFFPWKYK